MLINLPFLRASQPAPYCYYAFSDVHGYVDALNMLLDKIDAHRQRNPALETKIFSLGDLVNRGPDSKEVMDRMITLQKYCDENEIELVLIRGNHEQSLWDFLMADIKPEKDMPRPVTAFLDYGGLTTLASYGITVQAASPYQANNIHTVKGCNMRVGREEVRIAQAELLCRMPTAHFLMLQKTVTSFETEKFFFCHAGVDPRLALDKQPSHMLMGMDNEIKKFIDYREPLAKVVVHGHTPVRRPLENKAQLCIDTGIYKWGTLTAVALTPDHETFMTASTKYAKYDPTQLPIAKPWSGPLVSPV